MIPNPSLDCSYVVLNVWPNLSLVLIKKSVYSSQTSSGTPLFITPFGFPHDK